MKKPLRYALSLVLCLFLLPGSARAVFSDVVPGSWYEAAVTQMAEKGLLQGYPDGTFGPHDPITAAQFVTIAARCEYVEPPSAPGEHWAAGSMERGLGSGWYDWDELPPTGESYDRPISRQLAVKILMKALLPGYAYDFQRESARLGDFSALSGRYYDTTLAAYAAGVVTRDGDGNFRPMEGLTRAEACVLFQRAMAALGPGAADPQPSVLPPPDPAAAIRGGVSENGWLQIRGTQLCNERGEPVVLRGMSTHGLQWYGQYAGAQSIANTAAYGANVFRVAMYTGEGGYLSQPEEMTQAAFRAVDAAIEQDMYVILDWHILSDGDPLAHEREAQVFFRRAAERYRNTPNVIYEICNEPNGAITWEDNVKPYADRIVSLLNTAAPMSVILIGSSTWSQDVHLAAEDPVKGANLMYTLHFYAGTHGRELRDRIDTALAAGLPIFVSEWGTSRADGSGGVFWEESNTWLDFLEERGISWCNWSLCDKDETSAALKPGTSPEKVWTEEDLTGSGKFVFSRMSLP